MTQNRLDISFQIAGFPDLRYKLLDIKKKPDPTVLAGIDILARGD